MEDIQVIGALMEEKGPVSEAPPSSLKSKDPMVTINKIAFAYDKFTHNFFLQSNGEVKFDVSSNDGQSLTNLEYYDFDSSHGFSMDGRT